MPVQLDEETVIRETVAQIELPEGVRLLRIESAEESDGDLAWRIVFSVSKKLPLNKRTMAQLQAVRKAVRDVIFPLNLDKWHFVRFIEGK